VFDVFGQGSLGMTVSEA